MKLANDLAVASKALGKAELTVGKQEKENLQFRDQFMWSKI